MVKGGDGRSSIQSGAVKRGMLGVQLRARSRPGGRRRASASNSSKRASIGPDRRRRPPQNARAFKAGDVDRRINGTRSSATWLEAAQHHRHAANRRESRARHDSRRQAGQCDRRASASAAGRRTARGGRRIGLRRCSEGAETLGNAEQRTAAWSSVRVDPQGSPAAENGLRLNDVILEVGRTRESNARTSCARSWRTRASILFAITIRRGRSRWCS